MAPSTLANGKSPPRVLLVDDDTLVTASIARALQRHGYLVDVHNSGATAVLRLAEPPTPDVIVTDWKMPGVDGDLFLRFVAERCPTLPVVIITGNAAAVKVPTSAGSGASFAILRKPFHAELLHQQLQRLLGTEREAEYAPRPREGR